MRTNSSVNDLESRAIAALRAVLGQVSVIKLREIRREDQDPGNDLILVAHLDVLGRAHKLACEVQPNVQPGRLRSALRKTRDSESATRVIIAPYLSPEAQSLCKESHTGFLDLEGNSRIELGEVFIGRRSLTRNSARRVVANPMRDADTFTPPMRDSGALMPFPPRAVSQTALIGVAAVPA